MTEVEKRILENQMEILWALRNLAERASPDLVGRGGALDRMRDDLADAAKRTQAIMENHIPDLPQTLPGTPLAEPPSGLTAEDREQDRR